MGTGGMPASLLQTPLQPLLQPGCAGWGLWILGSWVTRGAPEAMPSSAPTWPKPTGDPNSKAGQACCPALVPGCGLLWPHLLPTPPLAGLGWERGVFGPPTLLLESSELTKIKTGVILCLLRVGRTLSRPRVHQMDMTSYPGLSQGSVLGLQTWASHRASRPLWGCRSDLNSAGQCLRLWVKWVFPSWKRCCPLVVDLLWERKYSQLA